MATPTLAELLSPPTVQQTFQILLGVYQSAGFPVDSWQVGGTERTRLMAIATAITDLASNYQVGIVSGGFTSLAPNTGWMPLLAHELYDLDQEEATFTIGDILLSSASGIGAATYAAGKIKINFAASGNNYFNNASITVPAGVGTVVGSFTAEFPGSSYNDPSNSGSLSLVTPLPGVTPTNPAGDYGDQAHVGSGAGTLTLGGSPVGPHQMVVRIDSTGQTGVATWSYQLDGQSFVSEGNASGDTDIGGTGIDVTLVNDGTANPSFIEGDTYTFNTPGSWITSQGSNVETDENLRDRCQERWSTLAEVGVTNLYELLATTTPDVGSQVTQVIVQPDANINNKLNIVIAGPGGALPAGAVSDVQTWISAKTPITVNPVVLSPTPLSITLTGTITVQAKLFTTTQGLIETAMNNYIASVPINGTIELSEIIALIRPLNGVENVNVASVTINAVADDLVLGSPTTFIIAEYPPTLNFSWVTA